MPALNKEQIKKIMESEPKSRAWYEEHIREAVLTFYAAREVQEKDIAKEDQNSWVACCTFIQRECINKCDLMTVHGHQPNKGTTTYNSMYDGETIDMLCDIFLDLSFLYNRNPSLYAFCKMVGISRVTIEDWAHNYTNRYGVTCDSRSNQQKALLGRLKEGKGTFLENVIIHGKGGVIGSLAALNHEYGWSSPKQSEAEKETEAPELPNYPQFLLENKGE